MPRVHRLAGPDPPALGDLSELAVTWDAASLAEGGARPGAGGWLSRAEAPFRTLFEPFGRGPEAPARAPGAGIGLTLVARFAELHRGRAWVEDRPDGGASFRVLLPDAPDPVVAG